MPARKPGQYPELELVCVDAALVVWANPVGWPEARSVGWVRTVTQKGRERWAYETDARGIGPVLFGDPKTAALALLAFLHTGREEETKAA